MLYQDQHLKEEEESINDIISKVPIALNCNRPEVIRAGEYFLPYSTGFEIECDKLPEYNKEAFTSIPNILEVRGGDYKNDEQRFRIPNGIKGLNCLYNISQQLKLNSALNLGSGIHYHIDCTDIFDKITDEDIKEYKDIILARLDQWDYRGTYNDRNVARHRCWVRVHSSYKTFEFRIGEMTFEYDLLFKRIVDANDIVRDFKNYMHKKILIRENVALVYEQEDYREILNNRTKRI